MHEYKWQSSKPYWWDEGDWKEDFQSHRWQQQQQLNDGKKSIVLLFDWSISGWWMMEEEGYIDSLYSVYVDTSSLCRNRIDHVIMICWWLAACTDRLIGYMLAGWLTCRSPPSADNTSNSAKITFSKPHHHCHLPHWPKESRHHGDPYH